MVMLHIELKPTTLCPQTQAQLQGRGQKVKPFFSENIVFLQDQNYWGVIDDSLFENLGVIGKFRGSELFLMYNYFLSEHSSI